MSDQTVFNTPAEQPSQNNNMLWMIVVGFVVLMIFLSMIFNNGNDSINEAQLTPIPQDPQSTQIPQDPQSTQVPQRPQDTQVPQNPQSTQIPQPTSINTPTTTL